VRRLLAAAAAVATLVGCVPAPPPPPPPVAYGPTVVVISCAINEAQIRHVVGINDPSGYYRVHWYDSPSGPAVTPWQKMTTGVGYTFIGFGRGQVEWTLELDGDETIPAPAYNGFWPFGPWQPCKQSA